MDAAQIIPVVTAIRRMTPGMEISFRIRRGEKEETILVKASVLPFYFLD